MPNKTRNACDEETNKNSASQPQIPAVPPPDDPLRRAEEFDPDREFKSREMAEKRLEAIRKTREMPTANEEAAADEAGETSSEDQSDST
ncbi:MAG: hypothetical protein QOH41_2545 [Blastocatellia bacterium]|jgi:hypothetical protein|nr:hypothetical protein [Blastocatellia bacterium]